MVLGQGQGGLVCRAGLGAVGQKHMGQPGPVGTGAVLAVGIGVGVQGVGKDLGLVGQEEQGRHVRRHA